MSLGLRPRNLPAALAIAMPSRVHARMRVSFELGHHAEDVGQELPDRVGGVIDRSPKVEDDALLRQLVRDVGRMAQ